MAFRELGNVPEFQITPEIETLDHESSMAGTKVTDRSVTIKKGATLRLVMEEITAENLGLAVGGAVSQNTPGQDEVDILSLGTISAKVKLVGTNDVGKKMTWLFERVDFNPSEVIDLIGEEWMQLTLAGKVLAVAGKFGIVTFAGQSTAGDTPPDILNYTIGKGIVSIELL
jgi:hypothetical protein